MKKNLIRAVTLVSVIAALTGCVNKDYDLNALDTSMTILPGLKIHVNQDNDKNVIKDQSFLLKDETVKQLSDNNLAISGNSNSPKNSKSSYKGGGRIEFETPLYICTASWLNELLPGAILNAPIIPVIEVTNPTGIEMELHGTAKCGDSSVEFGPYAVKEGINRINLDKQDIINFFLPVLYDVEISGLTLTWDALSSSPAENEDFTVEAYAPLTFRPGDRIFLEYPCSEKFLSSIDIQEKAEKHHISVESLSVNINVMNSFPLDINISATGELDNGSASASISPWISAGSTDNPVKSSVTVKADLPKGALSFKNATVCVEGKVPGDRAVSISSDQNFSYSIVDIVLDSGITLGK